MKQGYVIAFVSLALLITACSHFTAADPKDGMIFNRDLSAAYQHRDKTLSKTRTELLFDGGSTANNCSKYLALSHGHKPDESVLNQMVKSEYLVCDALNLLPVAMNLTYQDASHSDYGKQLAAKLDLRSFPSSLRQMSDADKHTLNSLFPGQVNAKENIAILGTDEWTFRLEVVVSALLDDNKQADWIVWLSDEAKTGNYRAYTTLIIYNSGDRVTFNATTYP